jgi:hypothetical protein
MVSHFTQGLYHSLTSTLPLSVPIAGNWKSDSARNLNARLLPPVREEHHHCAGTYDKRLAVTGSEGGSVARLFFPKGKEVPDPAVANSAG